MLPISATSPGEEEVSAFLSLSLSDSLSLSLASLISLISPIVIVSLLVVSFTFRAKQRAGRALVQRRRERALKRVHSMRVAAEKASNSALNNNDNDGNSNNNNNMANIDNNSNSNSNGNGRGSSRIGSLFQSVRSAVAASAAVALRSAEETIIERIVRVSSSPSSPSSSGHDSRARRDAAGEEGDGVEDAAKEERDGARASVERDKSVSSSSSSVCWFKDEEDKRSEAERFDADYERFLADELHVFEDEELGLNLVSHPHPHSFLFFIIFLLLFFLRLFCLTMHTR